MDHLVAAGHEVAVLDVRPPHRADVQFFDVDILDLPGLVRATRGCDVIFHLAGVADVNHAKAHPVLTAELNVAGTAKVWEAARQNGVKRAVLASTVWVYSGASGDGELCEDAEFDLSRPGHLYTSSKIAAEMVARSYQELYGVDYTILRFGIPYGPRARVAAVVPAMVERALKGEALTVAGDGSQGRRFVYVEDLAAGVVEALRPESANRVYNLAGSFGPGRRALPAEEGLAVSKGDAGDTVATKRFCEEVLGRRTPAVARAADRSIPVMTACACGERSIAR